MLYDLVSKKTNKLHVVDDEVLNLLKEKGLLKLYVITAQYETKAVIPEEIVLKTTKDINTKKNTNDRKRKENI
jgi:hypothetical protein